MFRLLLLVVMASVVATGCNPVARAGPEEIEAIRKQYEGLSKEQVIALGYQPDAYCVDSSIEGKPGLGAMGFHAAHPSLYRKEFRSDQPQVLLLNAEGKVVGVEWETRDTSSPAPRLFGHEFELVGPHEHDEVDHWALHVYFQPDGSELFAAWNPQLSCPPGSLPPQHHR